MAVTARDPTHARHGGHRRGHRTRRQVNDPLAVGPGTGDPLRRALADEQAVAWTAHILFARRRISYRLKAHKLFISQNNLNKEIGQNLLIYLDIINNLLFIK